MPFVTLELSTGVFRYLIDKGESDYNKVISSAFFIEIINIIAFCIIVNLINSFFIPIKYCGLFIFYFSSLAFLTLNQNITRGLGHNGLYSVMSFMITAISLVTNLLLILVFGKKGDSILFSAGLASLITSLFCVYKQSLWKYVDKNSFSIDILKEILIYCIPLIPNAISWWVANTSDRLLIRAFLGAEYNGIYAAANKVPAIYITIYSVYNIAWIEALARGVNDPDQISFINDVFKKSIRLFGCVSVGIICCMSIFFRLLIGADYSAAYWHIYILLIAIFFNSLCSLLGGIFTSVKRSDIIGKTTIVGALSNIIVHLLLIRYIGLYAASISTMFSYILIMALRNKNANDLISIKWPKKYLFQLLIALIIVTIGFYLKNIMLNIGILIALTIWSVSINKEIIVLVATPLMNRVSKLLNRK